MARRRVQHITCRFSVAAHEHVPDSGLKGDADPVKEPGERMDEVERLNREVLKARETLAEIDRKLTSPDARRTAREAWLEYLEEKEERLRELEQERTTNETVWNGGISTD